MRISLLVARCALLLSCCLGAAARADVFINEIHYDDVNSTDVGEAIEVAAPAGTNLSGWSLVLYNGSGNLSYATLPLSGTIANQCGGFGTLNVPAPNLQNGSPDGIALVDAANHVVQFLSYEGTFTAGDGPASGMLSVDIGVAESNNTTLAGWSLQLVGTGTVYADFHWQAPTTASFGACNVGQSFVAPVDVPPTVISTTPANNATGVAAAANILIGFSEAVDVAGAWFDIGCTSSGAHAAAVSGGPSSFTLNPNVDFVPSETCTVTLHGALITDRDGTINALAADYVFQFQTAVDTPPTLLSSAPANNATSFPRAANMTLQFSEPVTLTGSWFALSCDASGAHTAALSGGPASYTLNPDVDFVALENCTWTLFAAQIHDLDGTPNAPAADIVLHFTTAADGSNYYAGVDLSSGPALKTWLHNRIKDHTTVPYFGATPNTWTVLEVADQDPGNSSNIIDIYKNASYVKVGGGNSNYNREHTWPNSLGFPNDSVTVASVTKPNPPYTDCHMLYLSDIGYNSDRGNKPYGNCIGCTELTTIGGGSGVYPGNSNWYHTPDGNSGTFEPWNGRKGDAARAILYMAVRYEGGVDAEGITEPDLELTDIRSQIVQTNAQPTGAVAYMGLLSVLLDWNDQHAPDAREQLRNDAVYSYQNNRNPFVDHPEWARCVFLNQCSGLNDAIFANGFEAP